MLKRLCAATGLTLALGAPVFAEGESNDPALGLPSSAGGSGLGIGADLKGRVTPTPPEAGSAVSGRSHAPGTITHSDSVTSPAQSDPKAPAGVGTSGNVGAGAVSGGTEARIRGEASGTID